MTQPGSMQQHATRRANVTLGRPRISWWSRFGRFCPLLMVLPVLLVLFATTAVAPAAEPAKRQAETAGSAPKQQALEKQAFEKHVAPILARRCGDCHNSDLAE